MNACYIYYGNNYKNFISTAQPLTNKGIYCYRTNDSGVAKEKVHNFSSIFDKVTLALDCGSLDDDSFAEYIIFNKAPVDEIKCNRQDLVNYFRSNGYKASNI